jgi:hypothetical protein
LTFFHYQEKKTQKEKARLEVIDEEIQPLQQFIDDAKKHRAAIKKLVDELPNKPQRCLIYLDFTKFTIVEDGSVNCFVVAVVSGPGKKDEKGMILLALYGLIIRKVEAGDPIL